MRAGSTPALAAASMNLAEVPKTATRSRSARSKSTPGVRMERRAVVEHQRRIRCEPRHQPVPHHPAGGREVEEPVAGLQVDVQEMLLAVLEQRPAGPVQDALRRSRGARRVEDVERMLEGEAREGWLARGEAGQHVLPERGSGDPREIRLFVGRTHDRDALERADLAPDLAHALQRIEALARVPVAVRGEQDLGSDLAETIDHAARAEIRRARRPDGAQRGRREHRDHRLRKIGQVARDPVARSDAPGGERLRQPRDVRAQLGVRDLAAGSSLRPGDQRRRRVPPAEQVLGEVEPCLREPARAGHALRVQQHRPVLSLAEHAGETPERAPERFGLLDREAM